MPISSVVDLLSCPLCRSSLAMAPDDRGVRCGEGHAFDLARQGYLNLSVGPQPANADTAPMVAARERFLAAGLFDPIAEVARRLAAVGPGSRVLDAGAGTGRLLAALLAVGIVDDEAAAPRGIALDVSTAAARRSARVHPRVGSVVADVWRTLPVADAAVDLVVSNFAPRNPAEFARVLEPAGRVLTVIPRPDHLIELRTAYGLLEIQPAKSERLAQSLSDRFEPVTSEPVERRTRWPAEVVADAIAMGPNAFHRPDAAQIDSDLAEPGPADVTVAVDIGLWRRR